MEMGLSLTLGPEQNHIGIEFPNAYWHVEGISYGGGYTAGSLVCYPSRDVALREGTELSEWEQIPIGGPTYNHAHAKLWSWDFSFPTAVAFPNGIPLDEKAQKTAIYNWIKGYTKLPFKDVIEP